MWSGKVTEIKEAVREKGAVVLEGTTSELETEGDRLVIAGMDDPDIAEEEYGQELESLANIKSQALTLLLVHRPERAGDYERIASDHVFSGHAHGGQCRLPYVLESGLFAPQQGFLPQYTVGIHAVENFNLIISRGLSQESSRIPRFFNPPETVAVCFHGSLARCKPLFSSTVAAERSRARETERMA